jgi:magnesium transporter
MPISFITGFFGMNFFQPVSPNVNTWTSHPVFIVMLILMVATPLGMFWWMRQRRWM